MDKFIDDVKNLISDNYFIDDMSSLTDFEQGYKLGKSCVARDLLQSFHNYNVRNHHALKSHNNEISCHQLHMINLLIDDARERWQLLPGDDARERWQLLPGDDLHFDDLSLVDAYRSGFVNAVLRVMAILGIDEKRVKG